MKKKELFIVLGMIIIAIIAIIIMKMQNGGNIVCVTYNGEEYGSYSLDIDQTIVIETMSGTNTLQIKDGKAEIIKASCPDKICMGMHPLSEDSPGLIVCLPNLLIVEVKEE